MDREAMLKQITIMDFMATDLHLYLNTHPDDAEALKMFNNVVSQSAQVRNEYEEHFGPLVSYRSQDPTGWRWNDCPWPWESSFNFNWDNGKEPN
ncbi:MAG: spore coat protein CotJB [Defluviitaleaceae bacterium]|nr:spore coat protein CotJB [Defluviitaleaceae bacterium]